MDNPHAIEFKPDGTKMFIIQSYGSFDLGAIEQFKLTTPWDTSTTLVCEKIYEIDIGCRGKSSN